MQSRVAAQLKALFFSVKALLHLRKTLLFSIKNKQVSQAQMRNINVTLLSIKSN